MKNEMNKPYYYVRDEDGLYRMFDVSHEGLENAIKACNCWNLLLYYSQ